MCATRQPAKKCGNIRGSNRSYNEPISDSNITDSKTVSFNLRIRLCYWELTNRRLQVAVRSVYMPRTSGYSFPLHVTRNKVLVGAFFSCMAFGFVVDSRQRIQSCAEKYLYLSIPIKRNRTTLATKIEAIPKANSKVSRLDPTSNWLASSAGKETHGGLRFVIGKLSPEKTHGSSGAGSFFDLQVLG